MKEDFIKTVKELERYPIPKLETPRTGEVIVDNYWVVEDNNILCFVNSGYRIPQCNPNKEVVEMLYPDFEVRQIHLAFFDKYVKD